MKQFCKNKRGIICSTLLTILIISIIFIVKGLYPFGDKIFGLVDFDHAYTPVYYKLWDILHGNSSVLFDWNLGAGLNCFGSLIMNSLLFPTSFIIGIFPRNMISEAMSFIIILKLIEINIFTYIALDKIFKNLDYKFKIAFTLLYVYSGWTFFNLSSILYTDVVALFPLFVLSYYRLMKENKWGMYIVVLTLTLLLNYYMAWMILFFIIGVTIISLATLDIKEKRKKAIQVTLLTLCSLGLSCCLFLPSFYQSISSSRMSGQKLVPYYSLGVFFLKISAMFPLAIPLFLGTKQSLVKKDKKINIFFILLLVYLLIGIFVEPINLWWHTGSYAGFPFRYSHIPSFIIICYAMHYLSKNYKIKENNILNWISPLILLVLNIILSCVYYKAISNIDIIYEIETYGQFFGLLILFIIGIAGASIIFRNSTKISSVLSILFIVINSLTYGIYFINCGEQTARYTQDVLDKFELKKDYYNYSDYTYELNLNFPYIMQVPSMQNRLHIIKQESYDLYSNLGYNNIDSMMFSKGGTIFSNLLLNNKYIFTKNTLNEELYNLIETHDGIYLYEAKYNLDYIIPYTGQLYNKNGENIFNNQNNIYKALFSKEDNLIENLEEKETYHFKKGNIYYINATCKDYYCNNFNFLNNVNVEQATIYGKDSFHIYYEFYVDEDTSATINNNYIENIQVAYINIEKYINFYEEISNYDVNVKIEKNKKIYEYDASKDTSVLIPITYDSSFKILVNGEEIPYELNVYNMISINIKEGKNKIELIYNPKYRKEGILITLFTLLSMLIIVLTNKKFHYLNNKYILNILFAITCIIGFIFLLKIYILSLF